jgi:predicted TIM-barrel fold metal-dependent hydrolase
MHDAGIDAAIVSPSVVGDVSDREPGEACELSLLLNEELSTAQRRFPGRVHGLAVLPLVDVAAAIEILGDAIDRLGLQGVMMPSNVAGKSIADPCLRPLYEEIDRRGLPIFLHPTRSFRSPCVTPFNLEIPIGYMFDTSFAMMSLIVSGLVDELPGLKIVHPHVGGTLPHLVGRMEIYRGKGFWPGIDRPIIDYLKELYFDLVCDESESLELFAKVVGFDRLLFSSDFPYWSASKGVDFAKRSIPAESLPSVLGGNVRELIDLAGVGETSS